MDSNLKSLATVFDPSTCVRKGLCPVTTIRRQEHDSLPPQSHSLYFEQHGSGPNKILFIMGLNSTMFNWKDQVDYFGSHGDYSLLVFDNRGVGNSGTPKGPYTTNGMAVDVMVLLDFVGWTEKRSVHVVGISMGGMIAQELATHIPERMLSLTLATTTPGGRVWNNFPSWKGVVTLTRLLMSNDLSFKIRILLDVSFPTEWLDQRASGDSQGRTNREVQFELYTRRLMRTRPQTLIGALSQMYAGLTHHVSGGRLNSIGLGVPKVVVVTGDDDLMVDPRGSELIWRGLTGEEGVVKEGLKWQYREGGMNVDFIKWEKTGHPIHLQWPDRFNTLLEAVFDEGKKVVREE